MINLITLYKDGEQILVNQEILPDYIAKGWSNEPAESEKQPKASKDTPEIEMPTDGVFEQFSDEQLLDFAQVAGLPSTIKKRETLIKRLTEAGFNPNEFNS